MKMLIFGNCQAESMAALIAAMTNQEVTTDHVRLLPVHVELLSTGKLRIADLKRGKSDVSMLVESSDLILLQNGFEFSQHFLREFPHASHKLAYFPRITFTGFHPDMIHVRNAVPGSAGYLPSPIGFLHSSLACYGWMQGLSADETVGLYQEEVFDALGFFDYWDAAAQFLLQAGMDAGQPLDLLLGRWSAKGQWMYTITHPKLFVLADLARALLAREGLPFAPDIEQGMEDSLASGPVWSVYPEIAQRLKARGMDVEGKYEFTPGGRAAPQAASEAKIHAFDLEGFVSASFEKYKFFRDDDFKFCDRLSSSRYEGLSRFVRRRIAGKPVERDAPAASQPFVTAAKRVGRNPYRGLPDYRFWRRAIEQVPLREVDPVVTGCFKLKREDMVATAGSCFAQHISRTLVKNGFNYYIAERGEAYSPEEARRRNYGVFSARFGNLYTARQLLQLFDRAYGTFVPEDNSWVREDGRLVDPFRPQIEPEGFATVEELERSRANHFAAVREMFERLDIFVFTLGLTEAWRRRADGAVYPLAQGVAGGELDADRHEFVNFGVAEVTADLQGFVERLLRVNPRARVILTVSPVPLIATYEDRHVLLSTTYSKSVLRVAAEEICRRNAMCAYFPSYEIITGNYTRGEYFEEDLRSVKPQGVDHVMRLFLAHYSAEKLSVSLEDELMRENAAAAEVVCDEEAIDE